MNDIQRLKKRGLVQLLGWETIYAQIYSEAIETNDPRINKPGGVLEQLDNIRYAIQELRVEAGIPIPEIVIHMKTLVLTGENKLKE